MESAPRRFELLERLVVDDRVDLLGQLPVERGAHRIDGRKDVIADDSRVSKRLLRKRLDRYLDASLPGVVTRLEFFLKQRRELVDLDGLRLWLRLRRRLIYGRHSYPSQRTSRGLLLRSLRNRLGRFCFSSSTSLTRGLPGFVLELRSRHRLQKRRILEQAVQQFLRTVLAVHVKQEVVELLTSLKQFRESRYRLCDLAWREVFDAVECEVDGQLTVARQRVVDMNAARGAIADIRWSKLSMSNSTKSRLSSAFFSAWLCPERSLITPITNGSSTF